MDSHSYIITITLFGLAALGMAWMPYITKRTQISYSLIYVLVGVLAYAAFKHLERPNPLLYPNVTLHMTELVVIISLMGTGLKIDQPFSFKTWKIPFRLVTVTMLLSIAAVTFIAWKFLHFDLPAALLLGAALAPTDPVLASDVQVGPPLERKKDNVRFSLTAEAGMNDGMAFPFTWLAIAFAIMATDHSNALTEWVVRDVVYKIAAGVGCGFAMGRLLAFLVFYLPEKRNFVVIRDGFVAVSATLLVYGITELVKGYGFIAVFVTAVTLRNYELHHKFHRKLHEFTDQIERILLAIVLILFGGSLATGILKPLSLPMILFGLAFVLLIRPISGWLGLAGTKLHVKEKTGIAFFGIRGMGSFYYLAFALQQASFNQGPQLWAIVSFIVLLSVLIHGVTATSVIKKLEHEFAHVDESVPQQVKDTIIE